MRQFPLAVIAVMTITLLVGWIAAQEKEKPPRIVGVLPPNWGKLGLNDDQKKRIYAIQDEYRPKEEALEKQLQELKIKRRADLEKVLTDEQKQKLKDLLTGKEAKKE